MPNVNTVPVHACCNSPEFGSTSKDWGGRGEGEGRREEGEGWGEEGGGTTESGDNMYICTFGHRKNLRAQSLTQIYKHHA